MENFKLEKLNEVQKMAVLSDSKYILVTAGAGSGKTRVLTERIINLINCKYISPFNILAITFTNKASNVMKERLAEKGLSVTGLWISTFHSICVRILRENASLLQGYGMTEAVAAVCLDPQFASRPGTIGIPFPSNYIKIVKPGTHQEADIDEDGELCICGPTVMLGYYNNEKETNDALHIHDDGNVWLHSGDIASMDKDGYITYKQRLKRMIVSSGYNVYPSQIEEVIERHEAVMDCSVIGIPHPYKVEVAKAYIALKQGFRDTPKLRQELLELCKKNLAAYSVPKEFEFRKSLPKTLIGKVDFRKLQQENMEKRAEEKYGK